MVRKKTKAKRPVLKRGHDYSDQALGFKCPVCGAPPGEYCQGYGRKANDIHAARYAAAGIGVGAVRQDLCCANRFFQGRYIGPCANYTIRDKWMCPSHWLLNGAAIQVYGDAPTRKKPKYRAGTVVDVVEEYKRRRCR